MVQDVLLFLLIVSVWVVGVSIEGKLSKMVCHLSDLLDVNVAAADTAQRSLGIAANQLAFPKNRRTMHDSPPADWKGRTVEAEADS